MKVLFYVVGVLLILSCIAEVIYQIKLFKEVKEQELEENKKLKGGK